MDVDADLAFASFREGIEKKIGDADAVTHLNLAQAYGQMGLMADAIRQAAITLGEGTPLAVASRALNWIFSPDLARPDAMGTIARMLQGE
jgi:hypothetical protein